MSANSRRQLNNSRIVFSIGAKLIIIISIIVVLSLGSITALVSWLVQADLRITAEEANFEANRRSAMEAELIFENMRSNSRILINTISSMGIESDIAKETTQVFFWENPQIAAVFFIGGGTSGQVLLNQQFLASHEIDETLVQPYFQNQRDALGRVVRGERVLLNAAPEFSGSVLALFFPLYGAGMVAGGVLFSSEELNNNFGIGTNQSYVINAQGDILVSADYELVRNAVNISNEDFIRSILDSPERSRQQLIEDEFRFLRSASDPVNTNFLSLTLNNLRQMILPVFNKVKSQLFRLIEITGIPLTVPSTAAGGSVRSGQSGEIGTIRQFVAFTKINIAGAVVITSIEYDKVFEGIAATTRRNIYLTVAVLSISIIFVWFFSKNISIPLKTLAEAAGKIESGTFNLELRKTKRRDEIGILNGNFQKMCSALNIFGRFTNKEIAVKAMHGEIRPGGLPKHATVFFSDIRSFTSISENFTKTFGDEASDRIVHWLNIYLAQMVDCIEKTNGVVDKFIGDAVMAHWGTAYSAGSPRKDAFNCVKAALMMRKALFVLNSERKEDDPANPVIRIGCGINSGIVTAGQIGSDLRMEYTVIGDPVNLASRVEALTKPLCADILITEDTWNLIGDKLIVEEMPSVTVKGKEKPVRIFAVVNLTDNKKGPQTLSEVRELLGIEQPDISKVDINADEKKYKIGGE